MEAFSESWMGRRVDRRVKHGAHELSLGPDQRSADVTEDRYKAPKARPLRGKKRRTQDQLRIPMPAPTMIDNCFTIFPNFELPVVTPYASR